MEPPRWFPILILAILGLAIVGVGGGVWWYLNGPNEMDSADLVPANSVFFASIPNGAQIAEGYATSKAKQLLDSPNIKPLHDTLASFAGQRNLDLLMAFLPNLSGQSFIAVTHFDYDHPDEIGLIAAMKPKPGLGDFEGFIAKLKETWPEALKQGQTGTDSIDGLDYQWIRGPGATDKICVAKIDGWIVTAWGEASLRDWLQRYRHKPTTSNLNEDPNYKQAVVRIGDAPMSVVYVNLQIIAQALAVEADKQYPGSGAYLTQKFQAVGGAAVGTRFENGEIVDRYTFSFPRPAQLDSGMSSEACPFDTLKFTGPDTRFYWAANIDWKQYYTNIKSQTGPSAYNNTSFNPVANNLFGYIKAWVHSENLDTQRNIVDALGPEVSLQAEWSADSTYPELGLFVKVDQPDDFKPTINAIIETARKVYENSAVVQKMSFAGQDFAALQFIQSYPITPTITEGGPYLGVFLTENQAVRSFQRNANLGLAHRAEFTAQVGDRTTGAAQLCFIDTPYLLNRAYTTVMPYLSFAGMFDKNIGAFLQGQNLPPDLTWLAPMGTWSCIITPDEEGIQVYSVSGIGNQGILLSAGLGAGSNVLQSLGYLPHLIAPPPASAFSNSATDASLSTSAAAPAPLPPAPPVTPNYAPFPSVIAIGADGGITVDRTHVPQEQLVDFLRNEKAAHPSASLTVKVDPNSLPDTLSSVMDAATTAGFGVPPYSYIAATPAQLLSTNDAPQDAAAAVVSPNSVAAVPSSPPATVVNPPAPPTHAAPAPKSTHATTNPPPFGPMPPP